VAVASAGLYASLHPMQTTTPTSHHSVFLQAGCPSRCPTNSVKALKEQRHYKPFHIIQTCTNKFRNSFIPYSNIEQFHMIDIRVVMCTLYFLCVMCYCVYFLKQEAQLLLGWPTVLPHNVNPNPKPITNFFFKFCLSLQCQHVPHPN